MEFLEFEVPIKEILDQIEKCKSIENESDVDITKTYNLLQKKLVEVKKDIYGNLSAWQKVQLSRHPDRPYTLDYINNICGDSFLELHGDRNISDDKAMIGGLGKIDNQSFMFIGIFVAISWVPEFPGATYSLSVNLLSAIFNAKACSLPPEPSISMFINVFL